MRCKQLLYVLLLVSSATACASPKVGYDFNPGTNFSAYHTYAWMSDKQEATGDKRLDNSLVDTRIRTTIGSQLLAKGYTVQAGRSPDFYVAYHVGVHDMMKETTAQNYIGDHAYGTFTTVRDVQPYKEGTLLIDIIDAVSQKVVWQASALAEVDPGMTPEERDARIGGVVGAMFAHFPPK